MPTMTTMKLSTDTRDRLKDMAAEEGTTLEGAVQKLLRMQRQLQMGIDLAHGEPDGDQDAVVAASAQAVARAVG